MSIVVKVHDGVHEALKRVRQDQDETNWVIVSHLNDNPNEIALVASGTDGLEGLRAHFKPTQVCYALLRTTEQVDQSKTVKFVFIYFFGNQLPFVKRGRFGVVKGDAVKHFHPYHVDFEVTEPHELTMDQIKAKIAEAAGTATKFHDMSFIEGKQLRGFSARSSAVTAPEKSAAAAATTSGQQVEASEELAEALRQVRNDNSETLWAFGTYDDFSAVNAGKHQIQLRLLASGNALDEAEWNAFLKPNAVVFGLLRLLDRIDAQSVTVKFCYVLFIGDEVSGMTKGRMNVHRGLVNNVFSPYHVDYPVSEASEVTEEKIRARVKASSGTATARK